MRISEDTSEVMVVSRSPIEYLIRLDRRTLKQVEKFKYLGVYFTSDGGPDTVISERIGQAGAVMRELGGSVVRKAELSRKAMLTVFRAVFVPIFAYGGVMTKRIRSGRNKVFPRSGRCDETG